MAKRHGYHTDDQGPHKEGDPGWFSEFEGKQGNRGQPPTGEKDARGLTRDSTWLREQKEAPVPGDAARGPWKVDTKHKGD